MGSRIALSYTPSARHSGPMEQLDRIRRRAFRERRKVLLEVAEELPEAAWGPWNDTR